MVRYDRFMIANNRLTHCTTTFIGARSLLSAIGLMITCFDVHAARPMITDDARLVDAKACQVESWFRKTQNGKESWALPACNFTGNLELTLGGGVLHSDGAEQTRDVVFQAKTLFRPMQTNGWGVGLSVGNIVHSDGTRRPKALGDLYVNVPISVAFADDAFVIHSNTGLLHERIDSSVRFTWGLAAETRLSDRVYLVTETFGRTRDKTQYQLGLRFWIVPDRIQVDTTFGDAFRGPGQSRWFSIGMRLLSPPFLR